MQKDEIATILKKARKKSGYTRMQLSRIVGLSDCVVSKYELGYMKPKEENLRKLCNVLGLRYPLACKDGEPEYEAVSCPHLYQRAKSGT
jgi:transcriptional regulator with XRE-family HTH domain